MACSDLWPRLAPMIFVDVPVMACQLPIVRLKSCSLYVPGRPARFNKLFQAFLGSMKCPVLLSLGEGKTKTEDAVFEGRDMGTVVFPEAEYKFYLFADLTVRAKRRYDEMPDKVKNINKVEQEIQTRDNNDSQRETAPLKPAADAIEIDSTFLTIEQVVEKMLKIIEKA